jgi:hypothetical protein
VLFSDSTPAPPLLCLQKLEGRRPDVQIVAPGGLAPAMLKHYWGSPKDLMPEFEAEGRRVFVVTDHPDYMPAWMAEFTRRAAFGHILEVKRVGEVPNR